MEVPTTQKIWQSVASNPLLQIATLVTILLGLFSIAEKVWAIAMGAYHVLLALSHLPTDRKVFQYLKSNDHGALHTVKDIAEAIGKKQRISGITHAASLKPRSPR
jgi:hypothetical protein